LTYAAAIALTRISPNVSSALAAWGTSAVFSSVALAGLSLEGRSGGARLLWRFSLILLITGSSSLSADSAFQILGYSSITAALFGLIGGICLISGVVTALLPFLIPPPSEEKDDYGGLLPEGNFSQRRNR
jgi:hypothetical protein